MSSEEINKLSLEETFSSIEEVIEHLQSDTIPLEDSFKLYEKGLKLVKHSNEYIDNIEKQIKILSKEDEDNEL